jgi:hypothetical protein
MAYWCNTPAALKEYELGKLQHAYSKKEESLERWVYCPNCREGIKKQAFFRILILLNIVRT